MNLGGTTTRQLSNTNGLCELSKANLNSTSQMQGSVTVSLRKSDSNGFVHFACLKTCMLRCSRARVPSKRTVQTQMSRMLKISYTTLLFATIAPLRHQSKDYASSVASATISIFVVLVMNGVRRFTILITGSTKSLGVVGEIRTVKTIIKRMKSLLIIY